MRWCLLLAACGGSDTPLLGPTTGNPQAAWKQQLTASPTYHGSYELTAKGERTVGTLASDPAARKLHVSQTEEMGDGKDHYERSVEITIDGTRAIMVGEGGGSRHAAKSTLPPLEAPEAPFGMIVGAIGLFPFGGDLRQLLLDCLDGTLTPAGPRAWAVKREPATVLKLALARGDDGLVGSRGDNGMLRDLCQGATLLAADDGTLRGLKLPRYELTFQLATGASGFSISDGDFAKASATIDGGAAKRHEYIEALRKDLERQQALLSTLSE